MQPNVRASLLSKSSDVFLPALIALGFASVAEGFVVGISTLERSGTVPEALLGLVFGGGLTAAALLPLTLAIAWLLSRASSRNVGRTVSRGLTGLDSGGGAISFIAISLSGLLLIPTGALLGRELSMHVTPFFASLALTAATLVIFVSMVLGVAPLCRLVLAKTNRTGRTTRNRGSVAMCVVAVAVFFVSYALLPGRWTWLPAFAVLGAGLGLHPKVQGRVSAVSVRDKKVGFTAIVLTAWLFSSILTLSALPEITKQSLLYDGGYTGTILSVAGSRFDSDGDGFSRWFLGGDCDDSNPKIHPMARDYPGNGVDENCTGRDARQYTPPKKPDFELPKALENNKPNIVFILVDALRPDHVGANGYHRPTTPVLDAFLKESLWFTRAYTPAPRTQSAMTALFTGKDIRATPHRTGASNLFVLEKHAVTVAERLRNRGYDTVGYTISHVIQHKKGLGQGFRVWKTPWETDQWRMAYPRSGELTTKAAIDYLRERNSNASQPFFLFAHYRCTHDPYYKHEQWDFGNRPVDRYDSSLSYCDREIGKLLEELDARSDGDETAVFVFSDHGELFGDHGYHYHGFSLYEPDVRIVLAAKIPGIAPKTIDEPVSLADVPTTALSLSGGDGLGHGFNLLSYASKGSIPDRSIFMFTDLKRGRVRKNLSAVLSWPLKYITDKKSKRRELYNVEQDPSESTDLTRRLKTKSAEMAELLDSYEAYLIESRKGNR